MKARVKDKSFSEYLLVGMFYATQLLRFKTSLLLEKTWWKVLVSFRTLFYLKSSKTPFKKKYVKRLEKTVYIASS